MSTNYNQSKRNIIFKLKLTEEEKANLLDLAKTAGMGKNLSKFARHCIFRRHIAPPVPPINQQTYWLLARISDDLNLISQAVKLAASTGQAIAPDPRVEIEKAMPLLAEVRLLLSGQANEIIIEDGEGKA
ncbi:hypothetical protein F7734_43290 [Scytonema sp. UIC 10036]|uniref:plasmid mobilization protein n=1 Tax=Scytonema sp. UIC 10036 TaxID=2304196 RepID=UPI0012DAA224|nr:hypothetical protein [Scytonema sp. UIC 10036]MUG98759.1 hypothetical protein [Scytonema sp. UIC 10036]